MPFARADCVTECESLLKNWLSHDPHVDVSGPCGCQGEAGKCMCGHQQLHRRACRPDADDVGRKDPGLGRGPGPEGVGLVTVAMSESAKSVQGENAVTARQTEARTLDVRGRGRLGRRTATAEGAGGAVGGRGNRGHLRPGSPGAATGREGGRHLQRAMRRRPRRPRERQGLYEDAADLAESCSGQAAG